MEKFIIEHILKKYVDSDPEVIIPDGVTTIGEEAFKNCSFITSVTVPNGVTKIGEGAFENCTALTNVKISNSVTTISKDAFSGCTSLASIEIPSGVKSIGKYAFKNCTSLESVVIPDTVTSIGWLSFSNCTSLTSIEIPNNVSNIGLRAFSDCVSLTKVVMPKKLPQLEEGAFLGCVLIENIEDIIQSRNNLDNWKKIFGEDTTILLAISHDAPSDVVDFSLKHKKTCIDLMVKYNRINLISRLLEKSPRIKIGVLDELIEHASQYNSVEINAALLEYKNKNYSKEKIEKHENNKLDKLLGLKSLSVAEWKKIFDFKTEKGEVIIKKYLGSDDCVVIPEIIGKSKVTVIGEDAFYDCTSLTSIRIPNGVTKVGASFRNCSSLVNIDVDENNTEYQSIDGNLYTKNGKTLVRYTPAKTDNNFEIPSGVTSIGRYAFENCTSLTSILIPNSVTSIDYGAFKDCTSLANIEIPSGVTSIEGRAFDNCTSLTSILIPNSVTSIDYGAFKDCTSLANIEIPSGVTSIGRFAFENCTSLTSILIPNSVTSIDYGAFKGCTSLANIEIPSGVTSIGKWAFDNCTSLTSIFIPNTVTKIGTYAFYSCSALEIQCEAKKERKDWNFWNPDNRPVAWGCKKQ